MCFPIEIPGKQSPRSNHFLAPLVMELCPASSSKGLNDTPGFTQDYLPIGLSFFGLAFSVATLIKPSYAYEQARQHG